MLSSASTPFLRPAIAPRPASRTRTLTVPRSHKKLLLHGKKSTKQGISKQCQLIISAVSYSLTRRHIQVINQESSE